MESVAFCFFSRLALQSFRTNHHEPATIPKTRGFSLPGGDPHSLPGAGGAQPEAIEQERQLEQKRADDDHRRRLVQLSHELLASLEKIKVETVLSPGLQAAEPIAFVGRTRNGRLMSPGRRIQTPASFANPFRKRHFPAKYARGSGWNSARETPSPPFPCIARQSTPRSGPARAYARLLLARALEKAGRLAESRREFEQVLQAPARWWTSTGFRSACMQSAPC